MPFFKSIEHAGQTDVGSKRSHNQDNFFVQKATDQEHWQEVGHLFIVADGMGGHAVGEKASARAVQEIPLTYVKHVRDGPAAALRLAFQEANAGIHAIGTSNPEFKGLGTTATGLVIREEGAWVAHVGDSRAYRVRQNHVQQLTYDHSYAWEMAKRLGIPPEELGDIKKNVIVRSLGPDPLVQVDIEGPYPLEDGDTFVLCSDGLSNMVPPEEIGAVIGVMPLEEAAKFLIDLANLRGGPDNITVILVRVGSARDSLVGKAAPGASFFNGAGKLVANYNRLVPWPISVLMLGLLLAVGFIACMVSGLQSIGYPLFAGSMMAIIGGMVGLVARHRREQGKPAVPEEAPTRASVYRQYPVRIDAGAVSRAMNFAKQLKEHAEAKGAKVDWVNFKSQMEVAGKAGQDGDYVTAYRGACRCLSKIAAGLLAQRPKDESFKPRW